MKLHCIKEETCNQLVTSVLEIDSTKAFVMNLITASIAVAALAACTTAQGLDYDSDQSTVMDGLMEIMRAYFPQMSTEGT